MCNQDDERGIPWFPTRTTLKTLRIAPKRVHCAWVTMLAGYSTFTEIRRESRMSRSTLTDALEDMVTLKLATKIDRRYYLTQVSTDVDRPTLITGPTDVRRSGSVAEPKYVHDNVTYSGSVIEPTLSTFVDKEEERKALLQALHDLPDGKPFDHAEKFVEGNDWGLIWNHIQTAHDIYDKGTLRTTCAHVVARLVQNKETRYRFNQRSHRQAAQANRGSLHEENARAQQA